MFDPDRLLQVIRNTESFYAKRDENFETYRNWYFKKHLIPALSAQAFEGEPVQIADVEPVTPINLPTHMIDMAVTLMTQQSPAIEVLIGSDTERDRKRGNLAEKLFNGIWYQNGDLQGRNLRREFIYNQVLLGWGVAFTGWDDTRVPPSMKSEIRRLIEKKLKSAPVGEEEMSPDARAGEEYESEEDAEWQMPIVIDVPDPATIYPITGGKYERWKGVFREWRLAISEAEDYFGVELPRGENVPPEMQASEDDFKVTVVDFWHWVGTEIWHCVVAKNLPTYSQEGDQWQREFKGYAWIKEPTPMPEYARLPYEIAFCIPTTDSRGEYFGLGILYKVLDSLRELELTANRMAMITDLYADPMMIGEFNTQLDEGATYPVMKRGPGQTITIDKGKGQDVRLLQWPGSPPDMSRLIEMYDKLVREMGFDMTQEGKSGLDSIVMRAGILAKLIQPISEAERAFEAIHSRIIHFMTTLVKDKSLKVHGKLTIDDSSEAFALDVTGSKLKGMNRAKVTIKPRMPYEELQNVNAAQALLMSKLFSKETIQTKFLNVEDPERENARIAREVAEDPMLWIPKLSDIVMQQLVQDHVPQPQDAGTPPTPPQGQNTSNDLQSQALQRMMAKGSMTEDQSQMMQGPGLPTGNMPGMPSPSASSAIQGTSNPGRQA